MVTRCLLTEHINNQTPPLNVDTAGTWVYTSGPAGSTVDVDTTTYNIGATLPGFNPCVIFDYKSGTGPGDHVFTYTLPASACGPSDSSTLTINYVFARITNSIINCNNALRMYHPDSAIEDHYKVEINADDFVPTVTARFIHTDCNGEVSNVVENGTYPDGSYISGRTGTGGAAPFIQNGGFIRSIRLYDTVSNSANNLDINPNTTPYLTGIAGTVNAADLVYNTGTIATYITALRNVIRNAIATFYTATENINFIINPVTATSNIVSIPLKIRHNPTALWIGINRNDSFVEYDIDGTNNIVNNGLTGLFTQFTSFNKVINDVCNGFPSNIDLSYINTSVPGPTGLGNDVANTNYNNFALLDDDGIITGTQSGVTSAVCVSNTLTATLLPTCPVAATYLWSTGETTQVITPTGTGTYSVTITCTSYGCSSTDSYIIT